MKADQIRKLATMLHRNNAPEVRAFVESQLHESGHDLTDLYMELEMADRFIEAFRDEGFANVSSAIHSHPFYEIVYCRSNCGAEYLVDSKRYALQRGDIVLIPPGINHASLLQEDAAEPYKGYVLWISKTYIDNLKNHFSYFRFHSDIQYTLIRTSGTVWEHLEDIFRNIVSEATIRSPGWEPAVAGLTIHLLTQISRAGTDAAIPLDAIERPALLDQILAYIESNLASKITTEHISQCFHISPSTITHWFSKKLGISFYRYVIQRRLAEAKNLISEDIPLEIIASRVGFNDYSAFFRAFKQEYGISPQQFRKLKQNRTKLQ